jgi:hypothetical protein
MMRAMNKPNTALFCLVAGALAGGCMLDTSDDTSDTTQASELRPKHEHPIRGASGDAKPVHSGGSGNGIEYHGGPVMLGTVNIHYIWYGTWTTTQKSLLTTLASGLSGSAYEKINTTYYNGSNQHVSGTLAVGTDSTDNYSHGTALSDADILSIVGANNATDTNAIYIVATSPDVNESSGFCTQYCGWHDHGTVGGRDIKYAFVGDPARCPSACEEQTASPNGDAGVDGMASIIAHETEEAISDPDLNAWYDHRGYENADKCAWTFGTEQTLSSGAKYNVTLGGKNFLIQQNWVNANGGSCAMSY